ncbi:MAG TPA: 7TM diverse intracellular signaling domain-containing protein, partial [Pseudomonadales bacterium]|nr:7TM diverse intracellular signaling domain-containing protein [Pseudomonadales bacterium]
MQFSNIDNTPLHSLFQKLYFNAITAILVCLLNSICSASAFATVETVAITQDSMNLGRHLQYWIAPASGGSLEAALALDDHAWTKVDKDTPNFGFTRDTYWFRTNIRNELNDKQDFLLEFAYPPVDLIDLTVLYSNHTSAHFLTGDNSPFESRPREHHNFVIPIKLQPGESAQLVFKIQTEGALQVPLTLYEQTHFFAIDQRNEMAIGAYFGILIIMGIYNLFIFTAIRDVAYIYYTFSIAASAFMQFALHGVGFQLIWREHEFFNHYAIPLSICLNIIFTCMFSLAFLRLKEINTAIYQMFRLFILGGLVGVILTLTGPYNLVVRLSAVIGMVGCFAFIFAGWTLWLKGYQHARYYALAWTSVLLLTVLLGLNKFGWIPRTAFTEYSMQVGGILEAVLLSFALADRINTEKRARSEQERALRLEISAKEEQMRHRERLIEAENKAKSQFITIMSHELRTPLNG